MNTEDPGHKGANVTGSSDVQELIKSINLAYETGALFFLALELEPMLEEHLKVNDAVTPDDLELLVAQAAKTMMSG